MKKLKNRFLSCLLSAAMIISMVPSALASGIDAQPLAAGDSITIQEQSITTAATSVTVQVIGCVFVTAISHPASPVSPAYPLCMRRLRR